MFVLDFGDQPLALNILFTVLTILMIFPVTAIRVALLSGIPLSLLGFPLFAKIVPLSVCKDVLFFNLVAIKEDLI